MVDCIEWQGSRQPKGYGMRKYQGVVWLVHRLEWTLKRGPIPDGMHVLHRCDNPPCFNIDHLWLGTNQDNVQDKMNKGRHWAQGMTHCKRNHLLSGDNLRMQSNGKHRKCRQCAKDSSRASRIKAKEDRNG